MAPEITSKSIIVSRNGGNLDVISEDGELLSSIAVPAGRVRVAQYLDLIPEGASLQAGEGLEVHRPRHRIGIQSYGKGSHETGANPDFRPTSASRMEREMRLTLSKMQAATARVQARERALATIERIPQAAAPETVEVIEPAPAPAPAPVKEAKKADE